MKRLLIYMLTVLFMLSVSIASVMPMHCTHAEPISPKVVAFSGEYLITPKAAVSYPFLTNGAKLERDIKDMQKALLLTDEEVMELRNIASREAEALMKLKEKGTIGHQYDMDVGKIGAYSLASVKNALGDKYGDFIRWLEQWWVNETQYRNNMVIH